MSSLKPSVAYAHVRDELIDAFADLDEATLTQPVPSCPEWTVKDVAAHLCGLNAEKLAGVQGSLGVDEATVRQVEDRSHMTMSQVIDEWRSHAEPIAALMSADEPIATAFLADLVIHAYDLHEVLNQATTAADAATPMSAHRYIALLQQRVAEVADVALTLELSDGTTWPAPDATLSEQMTLRVTPHDFLRGVTGRLTRTQVLAFDWSGDPSAVLDNAWNQYGPFRS